jgi:hypothetical protein
MKAFILSSVGVVLIIAGILIITHKHSSNSKTVVYANGCVAEEFSEQSSGLCVKDIQTMVDFMETDSLNECVFIGAESVGISGIYNAPTKQQVQTVQTWANCYNKQEGEPGIINVNGAVGPATWSELCTYAYKYPYQTNSSTSPYFKESIIAGKNAGC